MQLLVKEMPGRSMQITPGHQTERFETSPCLRGKRYAEFLDVFRGGSFGLQLSHEIFRCVFNLCAQTWLGTNALPLPVFQCANVCMAPA